MGLSCKHDIQEFIYAEQPLKQDHIHSHWWLDPLADIQPVDPITLIQNPIRVCRRGRPNDASVRRDLSQWELALNQVCRQEDVESREEPGVDIEPASQRGGCGQGCGWGRGQGRGRGRGGHGGCGGRGGQQPASSQQALSVLRASRQQEQPEEQGQTTLSQFTDFAPVADRLRNMRPWGQGGQQALSYQGIPDDMVGSFQLTDQ